MPAESRAGKGINNLQNRITPAMLETVRQLNDVAEARGQTLAQMALAWTLRDDRVTSVVIGASREQQLDDNVAALDAPKLTTEELAKIDTILARI